MKSLFAILWLIILSDGVAAALASSYSWSMRDKKDPEVSELAVAFAFGLGSYSVARFGSVVNSVMFSGLIVVPPASLTWSLAMNFAQSLGMWIVALTLMNGRPKGFIRRPLSKALQALVRR